MRALIVHETGSVPSVRQEPNLTAGKGEALVHVKAAGLNFFDVLMMAGKYQYQPKMPFIPGVEFAGVVHQDKTGALEPGCRVLGFVKHGAFAQQVLARSSNLIPIPANMTFEDAAAFGMTFATSHLAIVDRGQVQTGETVLVLAAAGGVGLAAVQLAVARGATVIGVVGSDEKKQAVKDAGAALVLNYSDDKEWFKKAKSFTSNRGVDVVYDPVGGEASRLSIKCIAWKGRYLVVGFASGKIPKLPLNLMLLKSISVIGVFWGGSIERDPSLYFQTFQALFRMFAKGQIRPLVTGKFSFQDIGKAITLLSTRKTIGKLVLDPNTANSRM